QRVVEWQKQWRVLTKMRTRFGDGHDTSQDETEEYPVGFICVLHDNDREVIDEIERHGFSRDNDVLDTWFSSMLWPHSTFGWPDMTPELAYYYPTSTLVTSRDIITLWVARMVIAGLYNLGQVPFHQVYITPKVLDGFGESMSKMKVNGVDPFD